MGKDQEVLNDNLQAAGYETFSFLLNIGGAFTILNYSMVGLVLVPVVVVAISGFKLLKTRRVIEDRYVLEGGRRETRPQRIC